MNCVIKIQLPLTGVKTKSNNLMWYNNEQQPFKDLWTTGYPEWKFEKLILIYILLVNIQTNKSNLKTLNTTTTLFKNKLYW